MPLRSKKLSKAERLAIANLVKFYSEKQDFIGITLKALADGILGSKQLMAHVHSTKSRLKDPEHLERKLLEKAGRAKSAGEQFDITEENLLYKINDLGGFRILHLHTRQMVEIDRELRKVLNEYRFPMFEEPTARTWDDENREFFRSIGIKPLESPRMYTSVHYVVESNSNTRMTFEIQVRTLAEELWGEVDHTMNYPVPSPVHACREQIKVLARVTSSCTRLVDSIFASLTNDKLN